MKKMYIIVTIVIILSACCAPAVCAAENTVMDGMAAEVVFDPDGRSVKSLFPRAGFAEGELREQVLLCPAGQDTAAVYFCADGFDRAPEAFLLSQAELQIWAEDGRQLFRGSGELALGWIYLGTYAPGEKALLTIRLILPEHPTPDFSPEIEALQWHFLARQIPDGDTDFSGTDVLPYSTGDHAHLTAAAATCLLCTLALVLLIAGQRALSYQYRGPCRERA